MRSHGGVGLALHRFHKGWDQAGVLRCPAVQMSNHRPPHGQDQRRPVVLLLRQAMEVASSTQMFGG